MSNEKGALIKKKKIMRPANPVAKPDQFNAFSYNPKAEVTKKVEQTTPAPEKVERKVKKKTLADIKASLTVGRNMTTKSIRTPEFVYEEISLLSSFVEPSKMYEIIQLMVDSYVENELTSRQKKQFEFMLEAKFLKDK